jgi:hypothetical protein
VLREGLGTEKVKDREELRVPRGRRYALIKRLGE